MTAPRSFEENTLGVVLGAGRKGGKSGRRLSFGRDRGPRPVHTGGVDSAELGTGYLGIGLLVASSVVIAYGALHFFLNWDRWSSLGGNGLAWLLVAVTMSVIVVASKRRGRELPDALFALILILLGAAVIIDLAATSGQFGHDLYPMAAVSSGAVIMSIVTVRPVRDIAIAATVLGIGLSVALAVASRDDLLTIGADIGMVALTVIPPLLGVVIVKNFRRMVQLELDRALVHSTVSSPKFAIGMLASHELARLDLNAERLLDEVASGEIPLPLTPRLASTAASLATELRLHLVEGRRETWLYHVVTESEFLGPLVTLSDPDYLSAQLGPEQRDGLLSAIWLLMSDTRRSGESLKLTLGPLRSDTPAPGGQVTVPIAISTMGVPRHRIDPATWEAVRKVGRYQDTVTSGSIHIEIECLIDSPVD